MKLKKYLNSYSIFSIITSPLSVNLYNLPFLTSGLMHSISSCAFNSDNTFEKIALERDLEKVDIETLKNGLKKVWENSIVDMDFDLKDFEQLCDKFGLTPLDVLVYNPYILPQMSKEACNNANYQLVLVFDDYKEVK